MIEKSRQAVDRNGFKTIFIFSSSLLPTACGFSSKALTGSHHSTDLFQILLTSVQFFLKKKFQNFPISCAQKKNTDPEETSPKF